MRHDKKIMIGVFVLCAMLPAVWAIGIDWIQSNERVVGENSPLYEDVVNRPAKQIWSNFTSEHLTGGHHKPAIFPTPLPTATPVSIPTPLPTATPVPANALIDWTNATANFTTTGTVDLSGSNTVKPVIIYSGSVPDIALNTFAFWVDSYTGQYWLILDQNGAQRKVQLLP
jgi:hypothetical protein